MVLYLIQDSSLGTDTISGYAVLIATHNKLQT